MFDSSDVQSVFSGNIAEEWEKKSRYINSLNGNDNMMIPTIKKYITSTSKILEVGCGTGKLLSQIDALTFGIELTGVEMSSDMLQQIDTLRFKNPVRLINDSVENWLFRGNGGLKTATTPVFIHAKRHSVFDLEVECVYQSIQGTPYRAYFVCF